MQRRLDLPESDDRFVCSFDVSGLDRIDVTRSEIPDAAVA
jgi:hypothetical protein